MKAKTASQITHLFNSFKQTTFNFELGCSLTDAVMFFHVTVCQPSEIAHLARSAVRTELSESQRRLDAPQQCHHVQMFDSSSEM